MKKLLYIIVLVTAITSCKSDKTKYAETISGAWNIDKITGTVRESGWPDIKNISVSNVGTLTFNEDNSGSYNFKVNGTEFNDACTWANTDATSIAITSKNTGNGKVNFKFTVITNEKTSQVWNAKWTDNSDEYDITFTCTKK